MKTKNMTKEQALEAIEFLKKRIDFNNRLNKEVRKYAKAHDLSNFNGYWDSPTEDMINTLRGLLDKEEWMPNSMKMQYLRDTNHIFGRVYSCAVNTYILKDLHDCENFITTFDNAVESGDEENEMFSVERDTSSNRINLYFEGKPEEDVRNVLKRNGFRWSPKFTCWTRQMTSEAESSLRRIKKELNLGV